MLTRALLALLLGATGADAATLYVCAATGDDARSYATAQSSGTPWATIGRAAWGSTDRSAPNAAAAAQAGDTVVVCAGTYEFSDTIDDREVPVYNPVNEGSAGNYLTFQAQGVVVLSAPSANSPVVGAYLRDYVKWFADVSQGHAWQMTCDGRGGVTADTKSGTVVNTRPDTGPVVAIGSTGTWLEGLAIDGGPQVDYTDNYDGIRLSEAPNSVVRHNTIASFRVSNNGGNGKAINVYAAADSLIERNTVSNAGAGVALKDHATYVIENDNITVRYNVFRTDRGVVYSHADGTNDNASRIYGNLFLTPTGSPIGQSFGLFVTGNGLQGDDIFNNVFQGYTDAAWYITTTSNGARFWNNIVLDAATVVYVAGGTMPAAAVTSLEHNAYSGYTTFYTGTDGSRSLASFEAVYTDQHAASPAAISANPLFAAAATEDFRLCTAVGAPVAGCVAVSPARDLGIDSLDLDGDGSASDAIDAGVYVLGTEAFGVGSATVSGAPVRTLRVRGEL